MYKRIAAAIVAIVMLFVMSGCSTVSTEPDEVGLHYSGGPFSDKKFQNCVDASNRERHGVGEGYYIYPKGQRTFSFTGAKGSEVGPIDITTKDSQRLSVPGFVTFTLNTTCEDLQKFHEKVGKKYGAYKGGNDGQGWNDFLLDYIDVPLTAAMNEASLSVDWLTLYTDASAQEAFEAEVKKDLPIQVTTALGDDFITINAVQISKPVPGDGLLAGLAAKQEAKLQNEAQKEKNVLQASKYDSLTTCREGGLSETTCLTIYLAEQGDIPFYPLPQGGDLIVTP